MPQSKWQEQNVQLVSDSFIIPNSYKSKTDVFANQTKFKTHFGGQNWNIRTMAAKKKKQIRKLHFQQKESREENLEKISVLSVCTSSLKMIAVGHKPIVQMHQAYVKNRNKTNKTKGKIPSVGSSAIIISVSIFAWMTWPSVLRHTVPFMPIKQCSCTWKGQILRKRTREKQKKRHVGMAENDTSHTNQVQHYL